MQIGEENKENHQPKDIDKFVPELIGRTNISKTNSWWRENPFEMSKQLI